MDEEILALCYRLGAGTDQEQLLLPLVGAARRGLEGQLKPGVTVADCGGSFPLAAAMVAMSHLEGVTGENRVAAFTAGSVSIRRLEGGESLARQARRLLAPWLREAGFAFLGVRG